MTKIEKIIYVADDGTEFYDEHKCREYEESIEARRCMSKIAKYCSKRGCNPLDCIFCGEEGCKFSGSGVVPIDWEDLMG